MTIDEDSLDGLEAIGLEDQNGSNDGGDEGVGESDETFDDTMGKFHIYYIADAVTSSGFLKALQKLGVTFNFDKQDIIDLTKFSKMTMCRASEANQKNSHRSFVFWAKHCKGAVFLSVS